MLISYLVCQHTYLRMLCVGSGHALGENQDGARSRAIFMASANTMNRAIGGGKGAISFV